MTIHNLCLHVYSLISSYGQRSFKVIFCYFIYDRKCDHGFLLCCLHNSIWCPLWLMPATVQIQYNVVCSQNAIIWLSLFKLYADHFVFCKHCNCILNCVGTVGFQNDQKWHLWTSPDDLGYCSLQSRHYV